MLSFLFKTIAWLVSGLITTTISSAGFYCLALAVDYVKTYQRECQEKEKLHYYELAEKHIIQEWDGGAVQEWGRESFHSQVHPRGVSRGASIFESYKRSSAFLSCSVNPRKQKQNLPLYNCPRPLRQNFLWSPLHPKPGELVTRTCPSNDETCLRCRCSKTLIHSDFKKEAQLLQEAELSIEQNESCHGFKIPREGGHRKNIDHEVSVPSSQAAGSVYLKQENREFENKSKSPPQNKTHYTEEKSTSVYDSNIQASRFQSQNSQAFISQERKEMATELDLQACNEILAKYPFMASLLRPGVLQKVSKAQGQNDKERPKTEAETRGSPKKAVSKFESIVKTKDTSSSGLKTKRPRMFLTSAARSLTISADQANKRVNSTLKKSKTFINERNNSPEKKNIPERSFTRFRNQKRKTPIEYPRTKGDQEHKKAQLLMIPKTGENDRDGHSNEPETKAFDTKNAGKLTKSALWLTRFKRKRTAQKELLSNKNTAHTTHRMVDGKKEKDNSEGVPQGLVDVNAREAETTKLEVCASSKKNSRNEGHRSIDKADTESNGTVGLARSVNNIVKDGQIDPNMRIVSFDKKENFIMKSNAVKSKDDIVNSKTNTVNSVINIVNSTTNIVDSKTNNIVISKTNTVVSKTNTVNSITNIVNSKTDISDSKTNVMKSKTDMKKDKTNTVNAEYNILNSKGNKENSKALLISRQKTDVEKQSENSEERLSMSKDDTFEKISSPLIELSDDKLVSLEELLGIQQEMLKRIKEEDTEAIPPKVSEKEKNAKSSPVSRTHGNKVKATKHQRRNVTTLKKKPQNEIIKSNEKPDLKTSISRKKSPQRTNLRLNKIRDLTQKPTKEENMKIKNVSQVPKKQKSSKGTIVQSNVEILQEKIPPEPVQVDSKTNKKSRLPSLTNVSPKTTQFKPKVIWGARKKSPQRKPETFRNSDWRNKVEFGVKLRGAKQRFTGMPQKQNNDFVLKREKTPINIYRSNYEGCISSHSDESGDLIDIGDCVTDNTGNEEVDPENNSSTSNKCILRKSVLDDAVRELTNKAVLPSVNDRSPPKCDFSQEGAQLGLINVSSEVAVNIVRSLSVGISPPVQNSEHDIMSSS